MPPLPERPFIPIEQRRDIFFDRPRANTLTAHQFYQRPSPPPPLPPHPVYRYTDPTVAREFAHHPMQDQTSLMRYKAAPPPIPPKPSYSLPPALPPKPGPSGRPTIPMSTKPEVLSVQLTASQARPSPIPSSLDRLPPTLMPGATPTQISPAPKQVEQAPSPAVDPPPAQPTKSELSTPYPSKRPVTPDDEANALAKALAMSASESATQQRLRTQEDEDLARALQQSMEFADSELPYAAKTASDPFLDIYGAPLAGPSTFRAPEKSPLSRSPSPPPVQLKDTKMEKDRPLASPIREPEQVFNDQEYAARLVVEVQDVDGACNDPDEFDPSPDTALPSYSEALLDQEPVDIPSRTPSPFPVTVREVPPSPEPTPEPVTPALHRTISNSSYSYPSASPISEPPMSRSPSLLPTIPSMPEPEPKNDHLQPYRPDTLERPSSLQPSPSSSSLSLPIAPPSQPIQERNEVSSDTTSSSSGPRQYLDPEFTMGVCKYTSGIVSKYSQLTPYPSAIGFMNPIITAEMTPMTGALPNIIALPYGRCPPLHIQTPHWRHMLRFMARLSNTRIEPTIEAVATTKTTLNLRTVVQFVKVRPIVSTHPRILIDTDLPGAGSILENYSLADD